VPCDQITVFKASFDNIKDLGRLGDAAKALGWHVSLQGEFLTITRDGVTFQLRKLGNGVVGDATGLRLTQQQKAELQSELVKGYAKETVKVAAKECGWKVKESALNSRKLVLERR